MNTNLSFDQRSSIKLFVVAQSGKKVVQLFGSDDECSGKLVQSIRLEEVLVITPSSVEPTRIRS